MVKLTDGEKKAEIFRGANKLKDSEEESLKDIKASNDYTPAERENEKKLYEEAQKRQKNCSGDYLFRVRGPPWSRRIAKIRKETNREEQEEDVE